MSERTVFRGITVDNFDCSAPKLIEFEAKPFLDHDIDVKIECCGVCGTDLYQCNGGRGPYEYPLIVGHEIVGQVIRVGSKVTTLSIGDRVGIGPSSYSCLECKECRDGNDQYCTKSVWTYNKPYPDGYISKGGYASHIRLDEHFAFQIPEKLKPEHVAPLLCGGATMYSSLVRNGCGNGKEVAIIGLGGLGHMGILIAKAMGSNVTAISRSDSKRQDSLKLGATDFIATNETGWFKQHLRRFDLIIYCGSSFSKSCLDDYLKILKIGGTLHSVSGPPAGENLNISTFNFLLSGAKISSSLIASRAETRQLLDLAADKEIMTWIETVKMGIEGVSSSLDRLERGNIRYRIVLVEYDQGFQET